MSLLKLFHGMLMNVIPVHLINDESTYRNDGVKWVESHYLIQ